MPIGPVDNNVPMSTPSFSGVWTQHPTRARSGCASTPCIAALPTPPLAHWMTRYVIATPVLVGLQHEVRREPVRSGTSRNRVVVAHSTESSLLGKRVRDAGSTV